MSSSAFAVTHHAFSSGAGRTSDGNGSHASTLKSPSYTKSVSWQHYRPVDMFNAACGPESLIRAAGQIDCSRNFLNPPYIFLRDWLGLTDPNAAVYTFAGHVFNWVGVTHIIFSIVFAVGYCVVAEVFPKIKLWQGLLAGALAQLFVHMISFPLMGLTPPLFDLPWYENVSEIFGHLVWFWSIEIIRRDLRNRITHEPDPEIPLGSNR